LDWRLVML